MGGVATYNDNDDVQLKGATDNTLIGNVGDRLKVDASFSSPPTITTAYPGSKLRAVDMNASNGGVARGTAITTSYTTVFNYTGAGQLFAFLISFEGNIVGADEFIVKLEIDGVTNFEISTADIGTNAIYALGSNGDENTMGFSVASNNVRFACPRTGSFTYASSVKVSIRKVRGGSKQFRAGLVYMTKDS